MGQRKMHKLSQGETYIRVNVAMDLHHGRETELSAFP